MSEIKHTKYYINLQRVHKVSVAGVFLVAFIIINYSNLFTQQYSGEIRSIIPPVNNTVNFGPCLVGDTLQLNFFVKNIGTNPLLLDRSIPSLFLGLSPNDPTENQYNLYRRLTDLPKTFNSGESDTFKINFYAGDTLVSRTGWHEALLAIAFLPGDSQGPPISKIDTFFLRVKKTPYFVSGFEDIITFDSVYINPNIAQNKIWRVKNVWKQNQPLLSFEKKLITQAFSDIEILTDDLPVNIEIYPDSIINVNISYHPRNRGLDSMFLKLNYRPLKEKFPDSTDFAWTAIRGIGVEQDIRISKSNYNWYGDTLDLGDILMKSNIPIELTIKNHGNLPFGILSQKIINISSEAVSSVFKFQSEFALDKKHILPEMNSNAIIEFTPNLPGYYLARIRIESDIINRNIKGVQPDKHFEYIYIRANVISPVLLTNQLIDFGNVIVNNSGCLSERDTIITIYNTGNTELVISNIIFEPEFPNNYFFVSESQKIISANGSFNLKISFRGNSGNYEFYQSRMLIINNQASPRDTHEIILKAKSIPPISANLMVPQNIKAMPGRLIEVPIILKSSGSPPSSLAKSFNSSIYYNRSLLEYVGLRTIGTAMEGAFNSGDNYENPNKNDILLSMQAPLNSYFSTSDTIVYLKFKTYLGNSPATEISFIEPKFGDGNCDEIFTIIKNNGTYLTDSVCGLEYKAIPSAGVGFDISVYYNANLFPTLIDFVIPYKTFAEVCIYDNYGNLVTKLAEENLPGGVYNLSYDFEKLFSGLYFAILKTPATRVVKPFTVVK